jgi:transcriptional regulator with XRE-family HTH domain
MAVPVTKDVRVPICNACGELLLDARQARTLDAALEPAYEEQRQAEQVAAIEAVLGALGIQQNDLETLLGLSPGYISKLRRKEKTVSPTLYRLLHVLRAQPRATVRAVAEIAAVPARAREVVGLGIR